MVEEESKAACALPFEVPFVVAIFKFCLRQRGDIEESFPVSLYSRWFKYRDSGLSLANNHVDSGLTAYGRTIGYGLKVWGACRLT